MLLAELGFEVERAVITEGGVQAPAVVEALDIREDGGGSLLPGGKVAAVDQLVLQGADLGQLEETGRRRNSCRSGSWRP